LPRDKVVDQPIVTTFSHPPIRVINEAHTQSVPSSLISKPMDEASAQDLKFRYPPIPPISVYHTYPSFSQDYFGQPIGLSQPLQSSQSPHQQPQPLQNSQSQSPQLQQSLLQLSPQPQSPHVTQQLPSPKLEDQGKKRKLENDSPTDEKPLIGRPLKKQRLYPILLPKTTKLPKTRAEWQEFVYKNSFLTQVEEMLRLKTIWETRTTELSQLKGEIPVLENMSIDELESLQATLKKSLENIEPIKHKKQVEETVNGDTTTTGNSKSKDDSGCVVS